MDDLEAPLAPAAPAGTTTIQYQFALQGLTCSACQGTVEQAVTSLVHERLTHDDDDDAAPLPSIQVSLFPEASLRVTMAEGLVSADQIIETVQDIGFDAELVRQERLEPTTTDTNHTTTSQRVILLTFPSVDLAQAAKTFLNDSPHVQSVTSVPESLSSTKAKTPRSWSSVWSKRGRAKTTPGNDNKETDEFESATITSRLLRVTLDETPDFGVRTLVQQVQAHLAPRHHEDENEDTTTTVILSVQDALSFQNNQDAVETRRRAEIARERRDFLFALSLAIPVGIVSMLLGMIPRTMMLVHSYPFWKITWLEFITWTLTTPIQFVSGARFYRETYYSFKTRHFGMGFLICLGTSAAYFYSVAATLYNAMQPHGTEMLATAFETSAFLITFVILGKYLEIKAKARTSRAIASLAQLTPQSATLVGTWNTATNVEEECPEEEIESVLIQRNDILLVKPGENVPMDGVVVHGSTSIDESMLTGESVPVVKQAGDAVIGGTVNLDGAVRIRVTSVGSDTAMAQIIRLIASAQSSKAPVRCRRGRGQ